MWAVSEIEERDMAARFKKSRSMIPGSRGLIYCSETVFVPSKLTEEDWVKIVNALGFKEDELQQRSMMLARTRGRKLLRSPFESSRELQGDLLLRPPGGILIP